MDDAKQLGCPISVVLVDDHKMLLDLLEKALSEYSDIVVVGKVTNGECALSLCAKLHPHIVLLDINIGNPDGFEIARQIRKTSPGTRVIALSMFSQTAYVRKLFRSGGSGYVTKNSETGELIEAIYKVKSGDTFLCKQIADSINSKKQEDVEKCDLSATLSLREIEIIQLIRNGDTSREIAEKLFLTPKTIELHRHNILHKLNIRNTAALITFAFHHCL
jgi:DNA-binding NarL/FixJ family response regulator